MCDQNSKRRSFWNIHVCIRVRDDNVERWRCHCPTRDRYIANEIIVCFVRIGIQNVFLFICCAKHLLDEKKWMLRCERRRCKRQAIVTSQLWPNECDNNVNKQKLQIILWAPIWCVTFSCARYAFAYMCTICLLFRSFSSNSFSRWGTHNRI